MKKFYLGIYLIIFTFSLIIGNINSVISFAISSNNINGISNTGIFSNNNTITPIKHVVIVFQENVSFDHYFGTYPHATNPIGEPRFMADPRTPSINGLLTEGLLTANPNSINPYRLDRSQAVTCDMDHEYSAEQQDYNGGLLDKFVEFAGPTDPKIFTNTAHNQQVMGYYDGNTVTAFWNYAQHFAMSDNPFNTVFGPSTPG